jgi:hypothetical protein
MLVLIEGIFTTNSAKYRDGQNERPPHILHQQLLLGKEASKNQTPRPSKDCSASNTSEAQLIYFNQHHCKTTNNDQVENTK